MLKVRSCPGVGPRTHQEVLVVLPVVLRRCRLHLLSYPLLQLCRLQEVLMAIHGFHESLLARGSEALQCAHLLLYELLLGGDITSIGVLRGHHCSGSVPHLVDNATVSVQLQLQGLESHCAAKLSVTTFNMGTRVHLCLWVSYQVTELCHYKILDINTTSFTCLRQWPEKVQNQVLGHILDISWLMLISQTCFKCTS